MLDAQGYVAEATVDNFFIVTDHALLTPPTATNLKGVTRETLLGLAASLGIRAEEKPFTLFDVWTAQGGVHLRDRRGSRAGAVGGRADDRARHGWPGHRPDRRRLRSARALAGHADSAVAPAREVVAGYRV